MRYLLNRFLFIPPILLAVNFAGFSYALIALRVQQASNPWGSSVDGSIPFLSEYLQYISGWLQFDFGKLPGSAEPINQVLSEAISNSLGLLILAFSISLIIGVLSGYLAIRLQPARTAHWLTPLTTIGLAVPGFFIAAIFISAVLSAPPSNSPFPIPVAGFGWDSHLLLPVLTLVLRPIAQIAQSFSGMMVAEMDRQYITTARAIGNTWSTALFKHALKNIWAPFLMTIAGSFRWMAAELILVEWIFSWPGIGRMFAFVLIPPHTSGPSSIGSSSVIFLHPPLLAALLTIFTFVFLISDALATSLARKSDPRLISEISEVTLG